MNPSPDSVTLVTLIKLQKATKQRNKDEIGVYNRGARDRSSQNHLLAISSSFLFWSLCNAFMFNNLCETVMFSRREQRSAFTAACCVVSYFTVKALGSPHLSQRNVPINMQICLLLCCVLFAGPHVACQRQTSKTILGHLMEANAHVIASPVTVPSPTVNVIERL